MVVVVQQESEQLESPVWVQRPDFPAPWLASMPWEPSEGFTDDLRPSVQPLRGPATSPKLHKQKLLGVTGTPPGTCTVTV